MDASLDFTARGAFLMIQEKHGGQTLDLSIGQQATVTARGTVAPTSPRQKPQHSRTKELTVFKAIEAFLAKTKG